MFEAEPQPEVGPTANPEKKASPTDCLFDIIRPHVGHNWGNENVGETGRVCQESIRV